MDELDHESLEKSIKEADNAVCEYYKSKDHLKIERISGLPLELDDCYINLALLDRANIKHEAELRPVFSLKARLRLEANGNEQQISLNGLFEARKLQDGSIKVPKRTFIHGKAGVGKTTLCKKLVHEFLNQRLGNEHFDRLLWIPLRRLKSNPRNYDWKEMLQDTFRDYKLEEIVNTMSKQLLNHDYRSRTLLLLDGLDEISHRSNPNDRMLDFLQSVIDEQTSFIITSRPHRNSLQIRNEDLSLETVGFIAEQVNEYIEKWYICADQKAMIMKLQAMLKQRRLLQTLVRIPIQLEALCYTWLLQSETKQQRRRLHLGTDLPDENGMSTMTTLYQAIPDELSKKDLKRLEDGMRSEDSQPTEAESSLHFALGVLAEYAFQGMLNGIETFDSEQQKTIAKSIQHRYGGTVTIDTKILDRLSFIRTSDLYHALQEKNFHFIHLTFQEFFAAKYFVQNWQNDTSLAIVDLFSSPEGEDEEIMPDEFLQKEKYNPRLNIFWRFVTGLVQVSQESPSLPRISTSSDKMQGRNKDICTFGQLDTYPRDELEGKHRRLLMYCLNEVVPSQNLKINQLRQQQESNLQAGLMVEYKKLNRYELAEEVEFPERILCKLLEARGDLSHQRVLNTLESRPSISSESLRIVSELMECTSIPTPLMDIVRVIFKHARESMNDDLTRAVKVFCTLLKDERSEVRLYSVRAMSIFPPPKEAITALINLLKNDNENSEVRQSAVYAIAGFSLPEEAISALIELLKDENENTEVRWRAVYVMRGLSLPEEAISALIELLKDEDSEVRRSTAYALESNHPFQGRPTLIEIVKDGNPSIRSGAAILLGKQSSLPEEALTALIAMLQQNFDIAYSILSLHDFFYHQVVNLDDDQVWKQICSSWLEKSMYDDIACYESEGVLSVWSNGKMYKISKTRAQTQHLLQFLWQVKLQQRQYQPWI